MAVTRKPTTIQEAQTYLSGVARTLRQATPIEFNEGKNLVRGVVITEELATGWATTADDLAKRLGQPEKDVDADADKR